MKIQILVSTFGRRIHEVRKLVESLPAGIDVLVLHQNIDDVDYPYEKIFQDQPGVRVIASREAGLARSRNAALRHASADIVLPTDDDVVFLPGALDEVQRAFAQVPAAAAITFQIVTPDGRPYKRYARRPRRHSIATIGRISSIEIALRRDAVSSRNVEWDERFGLNGRYGGGLELAFMRNLLAAGCVAYYCPVAIVVHVDDSTGHRHTAASGFFRGAVYAKLYGKAAFLLLIAFAAKNAWRAGSLREMSSYTRNLFKGAQDFLRSESRLRHLRDH